MRHMLHKKVPEVNFVCKDLKKILNQKLYLGGKTIF